MGIGVPEDIFIETPSGEAISVLVNKPVEATVDGHDKTLILMIHGFPGHKYSHNDFFGGLERELAESGFHIARFDFRGCGASDGRSEDFSLASASQDIKTMHLWAKEQGYERFAYVAEGLGASLALLNMPENLAFMILAWPVLDPCGFEEQKTEYELSDSVMKVSRKLVESLKNTDMAKALNNIDAPVLIMHGAKDEQVPVEQLEFVRKHFQGPRAEITTFEDGGHGLAELPHRRMIFHHTRAFAGRYYAKTASKTVQKA